MASRRSEGISSHSAPLANAASRSSPEDHASRGTRKAGPIWSSGRCVRSAAESEAASSASSRSKLAAPMRSRSRCSDPARSHVGRQVATTSHPSASSLSISPEKASCRAMSSGGTSSNTTSATSGSSSKHESASAPSSISRTKHGLWALSQNTCDQACMVPAYSRARNVFP